jgi:apolipoprotein N-acyltransferase
MKSASSSRRSAPSEASAMPGKKERTVPTGEPLEESLAGSAHPPASPWKRALQVWGIALAGVIALWAAFPPLEIWPLAWLAPLPWLCLIVRESPLERRGYGAVWFASFLYWAALLQGIRLAHVALYPGWLVLSAYLAIYLPLFVGASRILVHRWRWPLAVAAPLVWAALELARGYLVTGFSVALLGSSQTAAPVVLQTADLVGPYGPSLVMMLVASAIALWFVPATKRSRVVTSLAAGSVLIAALAYGGYRLQQTPSGGAAARVMLVQGSIDTVLDDNPERPREMIYHYRSLTLEHLAKHPPCDLVVWPESSFTYPEYRPGSGFPESLPEERFQEYQAFYAAIVGDYAERLNAVEPGRTHFLVGGTTLEFHPEQVRAYNAALLFSPAGEVQDRYFKTHLVMFGEYLPFGEWFPILYQITPMPGGLARGGDFTSFEIAGTRFAPNICFESTVPHLVRRQTNALAARGQEPDVLLNTTNDGWFYGSSILNLHFQCAVLRAIENRKPFLIAANTGISGVIDGNGRIVQRGPSRDTAVLVADVQPDGRWSLYRLTGDWPMGLLLVITVVAFGDELRRRWNSRRGRKS